MKFKTKDENELFAYIDGICSKNEIEGPNAIIKNYDYLRGYMIIELSGVFLNRLEQANKEDYNSLVLKYSDESIRLRRV
jgi:hypothetical protein